jgi:hypothetical protein
MKLKLIEYHLANFLDNNLGVHRIAHEIISSGEDFSIFKSRIYEEISYYLKSNDGIKEYGVVGCTLIDVQKVLDYITNNSVEKWYDKEYNKYYDLSDESSDNKSSSLESYQIDNSKLSNNSDSELNNEESLSNNSDNELNNEESLSNNSDSELNDSESLSNNSDSELNDSESLSNNSDSELNDEESLSNNSDSEVNDSEDNNDNEIFKELDDEHKISIGSYYNLHDYVSPFNINLKHFEKLNQLKNLINFEKQIFHLYKIIDKPIYFNKPTDIDNNNSDNDTNDSNENYILEKLEIEKKDSIYYISSRNI